MKKPNEDINKIRDAAFLLTKLHKEDTANELLNIALSSRPNGQALVTHKNLLSALKLDNNKEFILSDIERINYYLGNNKHKSSINNVGEKFSFDKKFLYNKDCFLDIEHPYLDDLRELFHDFPVEGSIPIQLGDAMAHDNEPVFMKARKIGNKNTILLKLNKKRHWNFDIAHSDIHWERKKHNAIWRGTTTGPNNAGLRREFIENHMNKYDVGFSSITQYRIGKIPESLVKGRVSFKEQLANKFIVSIEGNDVATNLKWILSSNSVPVMPLPKKETWAMEGLLKPYHHYLPLNSDLNNLDEVMAWASDNDKKCQEIAMNGKIFMHQFSNPLRELYLQKMIIMKYFSK